MPAKKILVVDDHLDTRAICRTLLTHYGYTAFEAADGEEAVEVALRNVPDLLLLDLLMPKSDGAETLRALKRQETLRDMAVVLYTAAAMQEDALKAMDGVQRFRRKPIEARLLLGTVQDLIGRSEPEPGGEAR